MEEREAGGMGIGRTVALGIVVLGTFVGGFGVWAAMAPLESAAVAPGIVGVTGKRKTIQHLEGGIVAAILVREGERVRAGQDLAVLDDTEARAMLSRLEAAAHSEAALQARLKAERDGSADVNFPDWLRRAMDGSGAGEALAAQERIFEARAATVEGRVSIYGRRMAQLREEIGGLEGEIDAQDRQVALLGEEISDLRVLYEKNLVSRQRLLALQRLQAEVEGERARNRARIARARQDIEETRLLVADLHHTRLNEVVAELQDVEARLLDLRERISAAQDVFARTRIAAPVSGTVVGLQVFTVGGVVGPGSALMDIVPSGVALVIEARVKPMDIDSVSVDQPAEVRLTAFPGLTTPTLTGRVVHVSADSLVDERTGAPYYEASVALDPAEPELARLELQPGMPAEVMILTGESTPLEYLFKPILASLNRAMREE